MNLFLKNARIFAVAMFALFLIGCNEEEDPETPAVVATFTSTTDEATGTVTFENTSENATTYAWDFGDNTTSISKNPSKQYTENGDYVVVLTASNDDGDSDTATETITITIVVSDTEVPVITLLGDAEVSVREGDAYEDAGATATDNVDGDITANIVDTADDVDISTPGTYSVSYNVSDAAGNAATEVTRSVIVTEKVRVDSGLLTNGDFEDETASWFTNYGTDNLPEIRVDGGNAYFYAEVTNSNPDEAFAVNLSQVLEITQGEHYTLSFNASTGAGTTRTLIAGIGLNEDPWSNATETVTLNDVPTDYSLNLTASSFGGTNSRVLFDMNGADGIVVIDNVKLEVDPDGGSGGGTDVAPTDAPATPPSREVTDVISIYGEAYGTAIGLSNVTWDNASNFAEESIAGNNVMKINFDTFLGTDLGSVVDASAMTHFHMDFWIADDFAAGQIFNPKWSNHAGGAGETSAFEYTKAVGGDETKKWVSVDIAIADFAAGDNGQRAALQQFLISSAGLVKLAYVDNVYFYKGEGGSGGGGSATAPTDAPATPPSRNAADVISIYGEAYGTAIGLNNVTWDNSTEFTEESIAGNNVMKVNFETFLGTDLGSVVNASAMTHFHMDFWIADDFSAGQIFNPKWSNHAGGAGETSAFEYTKALGEGDTQKWVSVDISITDFAQGDNAQRAELQQFLISVAGLIDVAYMDNIYLYK